MYNDFFSKYYDAMYKGKDYSGEADFVVAAFNKYGSGRIRKILDVGCGTGTHSLFLAKKGFNVTGIDTSEQMINIAKSKVNLTISERLSFECVDLNEYEARGFDLVISMFNVINHILTIPELLSFFKGIYEKLADGGVFVFDCWNGIAAVRDLPAAKNSVIDIDSKIALKLYSSSTTDLFKLETDVSSKVAVFDKTDNKELEVIDLSYKHILWPPKVLSDLLAMAGLEIANTSKLFDMENPATADDWKITYICKKSAA